MFPMFSTPAIGSTPTEVMDTTADGWAWVRDFLRYAAHFRVTPYVSENAWIAASSLVWLCGS